MWISEQQQAINFRHRKSPPGYKTDFHAAGDPTLIIISQGKLRISLPNGEHKDFSQGDQFIASDKLIDTDFQSGVHGHSAEVLGDQELIALHVKLGRI